MQKYIVKDVCSKTKASMPIVKPYKLRKYGAWCSYKPKLDRWTISYDLKTLNGFSDKEVVMLAVHEVGHIKTWHSSDRELCEYKAELFALRTVKKYYPKYFTLNLTKAGIKRNRKWYGSAFRRVLKTWEEMGNEI